MFLIQKLSILIFRKEILYLGYYEYGREKIGCFKISESKCSGRRMGYRLTTVGYQYVSPNHAYPLSKHPDNYNFKNEGKRTLNEYQLVYITRGEGYFSSQSCPKTPHRSRNHAVALPGRWHKYYPVPEPAGTNIG